MTHLTRAGTSVSFGGSTEGSPVAGGGLRACRAVRESASVTDSSRSFRVAVLWLLCSEACYAVMRVTAQIGRAHV